VRASSRRAALFCFLFTVVLATPASAATVETVAPDANSPARVLSYRAAPGEVNSVAINVTDPTSPSGPDYYGGPPIYDVRDPGAAIQAGPGCQVVDGDSHQRSCQSREVTDLAIDLGDGDDQLTVTHDPPRMYGPRS